jgi:hypothetical protein
VAETDGCAGYERAHDALGNLVRWWCLDGSGKRTTTRWSTEGNQHNPEGSTLGGGGYAGLRYLLDAQGRIGEVDFLDASEQLVLSLYGYAKSKYIYDARGNNIERDYYDVDDKLVEGVFNRLVWQYDERGNLTDQRYFLGAEPRTTMDLQTDAPFFQESTQYDDRGRVARVSRYGTDQKDAAFPDGCFEHEYEYDRASRRSHEKCNDDARPRRPMLNRQGYFARRFAFDARGSVLQESFLGTDEQPIVTKDGYAIIQYENSDLGKPVELRYLGADGLPLGNAVAVIKQSYDERGHLVEERQLDSKGAPIGRTTFEYDSNGNQVEKRIFDAKGAAVDKVRAVDTYDARRNIEVVHFVGLDGRPAPAYPGAQYSTKLEYDAKDNMIGQTYFGAHEQPVIGLDPQGRWCMRWSATYDYWGNRKTTTCSPT